MALLAEEDKLLKKIKEAHEKEKEKKEREEKQRKEEKKLQDAFKVCL